MHARARVRGAGSACIEAQYPEISALLVRCAVLFSATLVYQDREVRSGSGCGILPPCASLHFIFVLVQQRIVNFEHSA